MAKSAEQFLNDLSQRDLVPAGVIASLRRQIAKADPPVTAEFLAKVLTDKGQLTSGQAQKILAEGAPAPQPAKVKVRPDDDLPLPLDGGSLEPLDDIAPLEALAPLEDLGLTPLDEAPLPPRPPAASKPAAPSAPTKPATKPSAKPAVKAAAAKAAPAQAAPMQVDVATDLEPLDELLPLDSPEEVAPLAAGPDPFADANLAGPLAAAPAGAATKPAKKQGSLGIVLIVLALVLVLGGAAGGAFFLIPRGTGDAELDLAEADYEAKQYDAAIAKYDAVLAQYPAMPRASLARVHRVAARVLAARAASPRDWQPVLAAAQETLPPIGGESDLSQAHGELAPLLTEMAVALAEEAASARSSAEATAKIAQAREALALADDGRFVPGPLRDWQRLEAAHESLALAAHAGQQAKARDVAIAAIQKAIDGGDPATALAERARLLANWADLASDSQLRDLGGQIAKAAAASAQPAEYTANARADEPRPAVVGQMLFTSRSQATSAGGPIVPLVAAGSAWGFDSASGNVVWRRPIGEGPAAEPVFLASAPDSVLLVDSLLDELLCVALSDGRLRWRHPLSSPAAGPPLASGQHLFLTTRSGQILALDAQTGYGRLAAQLPQAARVGAVSGPGGKLLYQLADDALVYVLSAADLKCLGVFALGHEPATVVAAPAVLGEHLVVAQSVGGQGAVLRVLELDSTGLPQDEVPQIEISGQVASPLLVVDSRLVVLTDLGRVLVYEAAAKAGEGLKQVAAADAGSASVICYGLAHDGQLLVAGEGLRQFGPPAAGSLREAWSAGDAVCLSLPQVAGSAAVVVQRPNGQPGLRVSAFSPADGKAAWQSDIGEPIVAVLPVAADSPAAVAVFASGRLAKFHLADVQGVLIQEIGAPAAKAMPPERIAAAVAIAGGSHVLVPEGQTTELLVLEADASATRPLALPGQLAGLPVAWRDGLAVPCTSGAICWLDPQTGQFQADPLQLPLAPGQRLENCRLAVAGKEQDELLVDAGSGSILRVGLASDPVPHLIELPAAEAIDSKAFAALESPLRPALLKLGLPIAGQPLVVGQEVLVPLADGTLVKVSLAALEEAP